MLQSIMHQTIMITILSQKKYIFTGMNIILPVVNVSAQPPFAAHVWWPLHAASHPDALHCSSWPVLLACFTIDY